ncbi:type III secretion system chaperone family protein [Pengzhenrongella sicca]|uniref:YbjN domain-containing protein n=1 Tax=Pengzhenrongella sicca TaxID=2819238 RepID=A0A8A4ZJB7_9MICO|nr:YbjN domain-containing protein [Pengzhenrongella sicca]QTE30617.1 YbjN domain-containing protein [Pengzhenrongella sicca]
MGFFRGNRGGGWRGRNTGSANESAGGRQPHRGRVQPDPGRNGPPDDELQSEVEDLLARELGATLVAAPGSAGVPTPLSVARIVEWFEANQFSYFLDSDGDLGGLWRGRLFYFFLFGDDGEILQIRGQWNREVAIERLSEVLEACNEWNADRIWPKAYVRVRDNGMVHVISEVATDLEHGVTDAQLSQLLHCGLSTGNMLFDTIDELYPDPATVAP